MIRNRITTILAIETERFWLNGTSESDKKKLRRSKEREIVGEKNSVR